MAAVAPRCRWEIITSSGRGPGLLRTASDLWRARKRAQRGTHTKNYISQNFKDVQVWSFFTLKVTDQSAVNLLYFIHLIWGWLMLVVKTKSVSHITCSAFVLCREVLKHPKNNLCNNIWHTFLLILIRLTEVTVWKCQEGWSHSPRHFEQSTDQPAKRILDDSFHVLNSEYLVMNSWRYRLPLCKLKYYNIHFSVKMNS